jgi:cell cycle checkpoint protein
MDSRPSKRRRSDKDGTSVSKSRSRKSTVDINESSSEPVALSSRPKPAESYTSIRVPSCSPSPIKKSKSSPKPDSKSKSLHTFFQPATEAQRWAPPPEKKQAFPKVSETVDVDLIEDDYDSYDEIFTQHLAKERTGLTTSVSSKTRPPAPKPPPKPRRKTQAKRFVLPPDETNGATKKQAKSQPAGVPDRRPWAQRFAPASLGELAVHKKKVSDVQHWLEDAFSGRRPEVSVKQLSMVICLWLRTGSNMSRGYSSCAVRQAVGKLPL